MTRTEAAQHGHAGTLAAALLAEPIGLLNLLSLRSDVLHALHIESLSRPVTRPLKPSAR